MANTYVVIEHGPAGGDDKPRVYGPYDTVKEVYEVRDNWEWSRWTTKVEVGYLGHPEYAAYGNMPGRTFRQPPITSVE